MKRRSLTLLLLSFVSGMSAHYLHANDLNPREPEKEDCCSPGSGALFLMTNQAANAVIVFERSPNGGLIQRGTFPTGGAGGQSPTGNPLDPLASQGSLLLSSDRHLLFAVNAGSNEISVFSVGSHDLSLVDRVPSGGQTPVSLTQSRDLLFVLNAGGVPNISGFSISSRGKLTAIPHSTQPLAGGAGGGPAEVGFSPDGDLLVVTEKNTNLVDTYRVN